MMRPVFLGAALVSIMAAYLLPWQGWFGFFPKHMVQHMVLVAIAAPLMVLALNGRARWAPPVMAGAVIEFVVVWGWHLPQLHGLGCLGGPWKIVEQASFFGAGLLVWAGALNTDQPLAGAGSLLLTSMHMTLLGALLTLAPSPLYLETCALCGGLGPQQTGGMLMLAIGTPIYLLGGLWLTARALGPDPERSTA
ncbi:cytochrome c oxidase assembly protein [Roseivivax halodurans]|nr:cytochrome c oxidase assembly protein [Roseivivax halodurans]